MCNIVSRCSIAVLSILASAFHARGDATLAITHVSVIDVANGSQQHNSTVLVANGRIVEIGPFEKVAVPKGSHVIDATGQFVIPGLWDMHAHLQHERFLDLCVAHGVTGVRHMFTPPLTGHETVRRWRQQIEAGKRVGPRIVIATHVIDGPEPAAKGQVISVKDEKTARAAVRRVKDEGDDFVKVYAFLSPEAYFAILDEAGRGERKLSVVGHVPHAVRAADASDRGQRSMEHCYGVLLDCSKEEVALRKELVALMNAGELSRLDAATGWRAHVKALDSYDEHKAAALFARFVKNDTWQVPTLTVRRAWASIHDRAFATDPRLDDLPPSIRAAWYRFTTRDSVRLPLLGNIRLTAEDLHAQKALFHGQSKLVKSMHTAHVKLLAGTDTPIPYCFPGSGLHDELELLVRAGLTPLDSLQTATRNPAEFLGQLKDYGTVEKGKIADLVLLEADPLRDIANVRKVATVVIGGKVLNRVELHKLRTGR